MRRKEFRYFDGEKFVYWNSDMGDTGFWEIAGLFENVDEYTGVKDDKHVKIFENDIVEFSHGKKISRVFFHNGCFYVKYKGSMYRVGGFNTVKVVGNIYQTPELLKTK